MALTPAEIDAKIDEKILTGGSRTRAVSLREILKNITSSFFAKTDSVVFENGIIVKGSNGHYFRYVPDDQGQLQPVEDLGESL
jgi:hypothetical protein